MTAPASPLQSTRRVLVLADLAGYAAAFTTHDDDAMAAFTQAYYQVCVDVLEDAGGRVVKFVGDGCLCVFPSDAGVVAVNAVRTLADRVAELARERGVAVEMGANLHLGEVMEGLFGPPDHARYDVIGAAMNVTARMGGGGTLRISRALRDALPDQERLLWLPESADVFVPA